MPLVTCPLCSTVTALPDPWFAPVYTCPHCRGEVGLGSPPSAVPSAEAPASPFEFGDPRERPIKIHQRNRTTMGDAYATGFGDGFGRTLGVGLANLLLGTIVVGFFVLVLAAYFYRR